MAGKVADKLSDPVADKVADVVPDDGPFTILDVADLEPDKVADELPDPVCSEDIPLTTVEEDTKFDEDSPTELPLETLGVDNEVVSPLLPLETVDDGSLLLTLELGIEVENTTVCVAVTVIEVPLWLIVTLSE